MVLVALVTGAALEGLGLSALLSVLGLVLGERAGAAARGAAEAAGPARALLEALGRTGIEPTPGALLAIVVAAVIVKNVLVFLANREVGYAVAEVGTGLRLALIRALLGVRWPYFVGHPVGGFANAIAAEAQRASSAYLYGASMIAALAQGAVYAVFVLLLSWKVALAGLVATVLFGAMVNRLLHLSRRAGRSQTRLLKSLVTRLTDSLQSVKPLKVMGRETQAVTLLLDQTTRLSRAMRRDVVGKEALRAVQEPAIAALLAGGLYLALSVWHLPLSVTTVLVFVLARTLIQLGKVQRFYQEMLIAESAFWSIDASIREAQAERESPGGSAAPRLAQGIRFERVGFAYDAPPILCEASLDIPAGALVAIVGPSGSGKTTLVDLLAGLLEPQAGEILVDGVPLGRLDRAQWRRMIGYVPQETLLLHDTVSHNVTLGDPGLSARDAERALRAAGAWEFVAALPRGADTIVGERGSRLSGGQRQRLAIARALVHRPALLILDEATSALDAASEREICDTLRRLRGKLTIMGVSHRPALMDAADRVYRLHEGRASLVADRARERVRGAGEPPVAGLAHDVVVVQPRAGSGPALDPSRRATPEES